MYRIPSIFLSLYLLIGSALLPKGDFSFSSQVSKLYDEFVQLNGSTSIDEFLVEELLEPFSMPEDITGDEPFEKECQTVPIDLITVNANITFFTVAPIIEIQPLPIPAVAYIPYTEKFTSTDLDSIFHPPRPLSFT